jgi:LPXTG-motif cell wall-anchored protein
LALRLIFVAALCTIAFVLFAGRASAEEAVATETPPAATEAPPPPEAESAPPPPVDAAATEQAPAPPAAAPPDPEQQSPAPADTNTDSAPAADLYAPTPPAGAQEQPTGSVPAGAGGPDDAPTPDHVNDQHASAGTNGVAVSNTGANGSGASGSGATGDASPDGRTADGDVDTGDATATGTDSHSGIAQQAEATATEQGTVDILQIGLIVNVGVGTSSSGANVVGAGGSGSAANGTTAGTVASGDAGAIGNASTTGVKQSAVVGNGDQSAQKAYVVNVGIGIGNSGLNITIGLLDSNGHTASGQSVTAGEAAGQIDSGDAFALGDASKTTLEQLARGAASGTAVLTIDQRAIVVNFGTAIANSGGNFAFASFDPSLLSPEEAAIVHAVLAVLAPFFVPQAALTDGNAGAGDTLASVDTGNASAVGNAAKTGVTQKGVGTVTEDGHASIEQYVQVGNLGLALANSGFNGALAGVSVPSLPGAPAELVEAQQALLQFLSLLTNLDWLMGPNPFAQFARTIDLGGGVVLELGGTLEGTELLLGWDRAFAPDGGPLPGGVRVRQISGVLNIGIAISDTGHNTVVTIVSSSHDEHGSALGAANGVTVGTAEVLAEVLTGDAAAIGNLANVTICQAFNDTVTCAARRTPGTPPVTPPETPPGVSPGGTTTGGAPRAPEPVSDAAVLAGPAGTLPFTGSDGGGLAALAGGLLALGAALASRRRREVRG